MNTIAFLYASHSFQTYMNFKQALRQFLVSEPFSSYPHYFSTVDDGQIGLE